MNEAGLNAKWVRADMTRRSCQDFTKKVLNHMRERLSDYQEQYGDLYNLEATPAESTSYRLAKHDVEQFSDMITASEAGGTPYYTNSSHLPVGYTDDIFTALDVQDELQTLYTSGTVFHAFLGEKLPDWQAAASLVKKIAENYRLPITRFLRRIPSAKTTVIFPASILPARSAERKRKCTVASPVTTDRFKTGMPGKQKNTKLVVSMSLRAVFSRTENRQMLFIGKQRRKRP